MSHSRIPLRVLVVEDNPGDIQLIKNGLDRIGYDTTLDVARDGWRRSRFCDVRPRGR